MKPDDALKILLVLAGISLFSVRLMAAPVLQLGASVSVFDYEERDRNGFVLDTEKGVLPGVYASVCTPCDLPVSLILAGRWETNTVDYEGVTNIGNIPLSTQSQAYIYEIQAMIRHRFPALSWMASIQAGAGYREWQREIRSTPVASGLFETYKWPYVIFGGSLIFHDNGISKFLVGADLKVATDPKLDVEFFLPFDAITVAQGSTLGLSVYSTLGKKKGQLPWFVEPYIDVWSASKGPTSSLTRNGSIVGTVEEPESTTVQAGLRLGLYF
ncbi:MAG: hypothetical protein D6698_09685 [Gammaproteobacteria bacterium]|nr:MAG: hypothetical protein D6698_09685 [Gammaproteobacteria bacterium]